MKQQLRNILIVLVAAISLSSCYEEYSYLPDNYAHKGTLCFNNSLVHFDQSGQTALVAVPSFEDFNPLVTFVDFKEVKIDSRKLENEMKYEFEKLSNQTSFLLELTNYDGQTKSYNLQFTLLPVVHIHHKHQLIPDEPKILAAFTLSDPNEEKTIIEYCGIETRGHSAAGLEKKSYNVEIRENAEENTEKATSFLGMYQHHDWMLDGAYMDRSLMRNRVSFEIWDKMQKNAPEQSDLLPSAIDGRFIELFINNSYCGVYCLSEKTDHIKLGIETGNNHGYLYKAEDWSDATKLEGLSDTTRSNRTWAGWELKYPDDQTSGSWTPLYGFIEDLNAARHDAAGNRLETAVSSDQLIDYYLFLNLLNGADNVGKNVFLAKKTKNGPFYFCPWDLDATWGRDWETKPSVYNSMLTFHAFEKMRSLEPEKYSKQLKQRWFHLRNTTLQPDSVVGLFLGYQHLLNHSGASRREQERWPGSLDNLDAETKYIDEWSRKRIEYMNQYFSSF
jgi:hypothetical protein